MMPLRRAALIAAACLFATPAVADDDAITVTYSERPPYMMAHADGPPSGLTATPAVQAFQTAGVRTVWRNLPTNRQLMMIKDPKQRACAVGWFRVEEREGYAKYTKPIYRDKEWLVLANTALAARSDATLDALLRHAETRVLVKDNYSYGAELDKLLRELHPTIAISTSPTSKMVQSISKGMVDMMFVSEEEGNYIMAHHDGEQTRNLRLLRFKDMPHGTERYIMCGKGVPDDVIARLNKAITFK
ncbi:transporter substrate-binding domain-containing protein [Duganella aceris]|uniref:Transporter substrate-binding domain-containing protein n=1 Tax=Duganella aceris TaxID=2703883 RepID=A0ABX0FRJ1_9BURK|nr:transporter substrate-binding domain-containing protein [Duganella aceris]NGZ87261.1 transporter substrate-binding domain-containing protein [Duganella aceris]